MDKEINKQKLSKIDGLELNGDSIYILEAECENFLSETMPIDTELSDKKLAPVDYEPIFRDLQVNEKCLQTRENYDDGFILSEFQLDQLGNLALSPETMILTSDILPSSSVQPSSSNVRNILSECTINLSNNDCQLQDNLDCESIINNSTRADNNSIKDNNFAKRALVLDVSSSIKQDDETQNAKQKTIKKRNKLSFNKIANNNNINSTAGDISENDSHVTVVAISTNKVSNTTQIVINTGRDEQIYQGKTSELIKATSNFTANQSPNWDSSDDNKEQDMIITKALEELGITDDTLQPIIVNNRLGINKIWLCPRNKECARKFTKLYALKCHLLTHYGVRPFKCDVDNCTWSFFSEFKLKRHKETHLKRKDYTCKIAGCKRQFTTIYNLWSHEKLHSRPNKIQCHVPDCEEKFQTKRALEFHMKSHDQSHAPYVCKHQGCDKRYYSNNALTSHQRCHSYKDTDITCSWLGCGKVFDKPCRLKAHMRSHTGCKPYSCNFQDCKWAFSSSSKLKRHQKKHTNERKFVCDAAACGKAFMRSEHLREHKLTHTGTRYFRCDLCDSRFSAKSSLYMHIKKHHKEEKLHKQNDSIAEEKADDFVFYTDKMIMLTAPCDTIIFNAVENNDNGDTDKARQLFVNDANEYDGQGFESQTFENGNQGFENDNQGLQNNKSEVFESENEVFENMNLKMEQGSARTRLTRSDVSKLKVSSLTAEKTVNILESTDISEGLLFTEDLSSAYYQDVIESTECQVLLLDPNAVENVINLKDFD